MKKWISIMATLALLVSCLCAAGIASLVSADTTWSFTDELADNAKVTAGSDGLEYFAQHAETGLSVVGKAGVAQAHIAYGFAGKEITGFEVQVQVANGFFGKDADMEILAKVGDSYEKIALTYGEPAATSNAKFSTVAVTPAAAVPAGASELKIVWKNAVDWTLMVDSVKINHKEAAPSWSFTDELADNAKVTAGSDGLEYFAQHAETGLSVVGKAGVAQAHIAYGFADKEITGFEVQVQIANGFFGKDADMEILAKVGANYEKVALAYGEPVATSNAKFSTVAVTPAAAVPAGASELKIVWKNAVDWTLMVDSVKLNCKAGTPDPGPGPDPDPKPDEGGFTDSFDNLDKVSSASDNVLLYTPHPETKLNVLGRKGTVGESSVRYKKEGNRITGLTLTVQFAPDYTTLDTDLMVSMRKANTNEWEPTTLKLGEAKAIPDSTTDAFKQAEVTITSPIPADAMECKVEMANGATWTMFLDEVSVTYEKTDLVDNPPEEKPLPDAPTLNNMNFRDEMENLDKVSSKSDNWEQFNPHPETDLTVVGKSNAKRGSLCYMQDGKRIKDFAVKLQVAPAFFNPDSHLLFQVRKAGSTKWEKVDITMGYAKKINNTFSTMWAQPTKPLAEDVEEVRFYFYNDVKWTQFMDVVCLEYVDTATDPEQPDKPTDPEEGTSGGDNSGEAGKPDDSEGGLVETGEKTAVSVAAAMLAVSAAAVAAYAAKKRKEDN